jgi:hypothetical protein
MGALHLRIQILSETYADDFIRSTIWCAYQAGAGFQLSRNALDATLLYLEVHNAGEEFCDISVVTAGDGVIFAVDKDDNLNYWNVEYPSGAPFYPSYQLDNNRLQQYVKSCGFRGSVKESGHMKGLGLDRDEGLGFEQNFEITGMTYHLTLPNKDAYKFIGIASDGILTCDMELEEVLKQLTAYKVTKGEFVKRRMRKFLKQCDKNGTYPSDDVSMAVVNLED